MQFASTNRPPSAGGPVGFRHPEPADGPAICALARRSGLDENSPYAYVMWGEYHAATSVVAEVDGSIVAFTIGFRVPERDDTVFVWQIAVDGDQRGTGLGGRMLDELVARTGAAAIEATVTPDNVASAALFRGLGARQGTTVTTEPVFGEELFPPGHDAEIRFRIPINEPTPKD